MNYSSLLFANIGRNNIQKTAFSIWGQNIQWYAIIVFFGFLAAIFAVCMKLWKWYKVPLDVFYYFIFIAVPISILGARIWSFIIGDAHFVSEYFIDNLQNFFKFEGMAIEGGVLFAFIAGLIYFPLMLRRPEYQVRTLKDGVENVKQISTFVYADAIIPCILIGQVIGRWGNFINGEIYGSKVTGDELNWLHNVMPLVYDGMYISNGPNGSGYYQPLFLYESFANFWLFIFIYFVIELIKQHKCGDLAASYFIWYGIVRIIMEPLRMPEFQFLLTYITTSFMIVFGILFILYNHLFLCKNRNLKIIYKCYIMATFYIKKSWTFFDKKYAQKLDLYDPNRTNYGMKSKPIFIRDENKIFYYKGH